jgi:hypothetical protein
MEKLSRKTENDVAVISRTDESVCRVSEFVTAGISLCMVCRKKNIMEYIKLFYWKI